MGVIFRGFRGRKQQVQFRTDAMLTSRRRLAFGRSGGARPVRILCSKSDDRTQPSSSSVSSSSSAASPVGVSKPLQSMGLNELQTLLREAVREERYMDAARLRDAIAHRLSSSSTSEAGKNRNAEKKHMDRREAMAEADTDHRILCRLSWTGLGTAPWLVDRLEGLGYSLPTTIQISAFESVNAMLLAGQHSTSSDVDDGAVTLEELMDDQQGVLPLSSSTDDDHDKGNDINMAVIVSGSTGSGKTLAYAVPLLSTLSESLFRRQRIRVKAEEDVTDAADDLLSRVALTTSPEVRGRGRQQVGGSNVTRTVASMGKSGSDVRSPLALIVVPTRELGVQTATALYELVGGSTKRTATEWSGKANMFKYKGPKGVKIGCILDPLEAESGLKLQTDVAITMPKYLSRLLDEGDIDPSKLRVIVFDEADLALESTRPEDLQRLFHSNEKRDEHGENILSDLVDEPWLRHRSQLTYMVGASVTEALKDARGVAIARDRNIFPTGRTYLATATSFAPVDFDDDGANNKDDDSGVINSTFLSLKQLRLQLDPGLIHERVVAPNSTGLLCLCRMLRRELKEYSVAVTKSNDTNPTKVQKPRVVIFFPTETDASRSMSKLRDAMWGDYRLSVLLPDTGVNPLAVMEDFKMNKTSVMLATSNSVRGLDFAGLTHVYTLYLPAQDPREYVHLAGRVGRIGQVGSVSGTGGRVTSILRPSEADQMEDMSRQLNFEFVDLDYAQAGVGGLKPVEDDEDSEGRTAVGDKGMDVEDARRYLEDVITLLGDDEEDEESRKQ